MTLQEKKMDENEMDYPEQKYEIDENIVVLTGNGDKKNGVI